MNDKVANSLIINIKTLLSHRRNQFDKITNKRNLGKLKFKKF